MVRNPSFPEQNLLSADELFSDGLLLPLHLLHHHSDDDPPNPQNHPLPHDKAPEPEPSGSNRTDNDAGSIPEISSAVLAPAFTSSKRWRDIFKKGERRSPRDGFDDISKEKDKVKKREKKSGGGHSNGVSTAELNIDIWPFSRSRSAGNGGSRPRMAAAGSSFQNDCCVDRWPEHQNLAVDEAI